MQLGSLLEGLVTGFLGRKQELQQEKKQQGKIDKEELKQQARAEQKNRLNMAVSFRESGDWDKAKQVIGQYNDLGSVSGTAPIDPELFEPSKAEIGSLIDKQPGNITQRWLYGVEIAGEGRMNRLFPGGPPALGQSLGAPAAAPAAPIAPDAPGSLGSPTPIVPSPVPSFGSPVSGAVAAMRRPQSGPVATGPSPMAMAGGGLPAGMGMTPEVSRMALDQSRTAPPPMPYQAPRTSIPKDFEGVFEDGQAQISPTSTPAPGANLAAGGGDGNSFSARFGYQQSDEQRIKDQIDMIKETAGIAKSLYSEPGQLTTYGALIQKAQRGEAISPEELAGLASSLGRDTTLAKNELTLANTDKTKADTIRIQVTTKLLGPKFQADLDKLKADQKYKWATLKQRADSQEALNDYRSASLAVDKKRLEISAELASVAQSGLDMRGQQLSQDERQAAASLSVEYRKMELGQYATPEQIADNEKRAVAQDAIAAGSGGTASVLQTPRVSGGATAEIHSLMGKMPTAARKKAQAFIAGVRKRYPRATDADILGDMKDMSF